MDKLEMKKKKPVQEIPIYEITVFEDDETGINLISLVDNPAVEIKGLYFNSQLQFESYDDYPKAATENAKIALRWAEENGWGDCGTPVGKARANQLAKGEPISRDTIARMAAFERHRQNSQKDLGDGCGRLMWLAWGGDEGIEWAQRKLKQIDKVENSLQTMEFKSLREKKMIVGPAMVANKHIYRKDEDGREYYVVFTPKAIRDIVMKFKSQYNNRRINIDHTNKMVDGYIMSDWIVESTEYDKSKMYGFELPIGSYFIEVKIEDDEFWEHEIKENGKFGFSVEGLFSFKSLNFSVDELVDSLSEDEMEEILKFIKNNSI